MYFRTSKPSYNQGFARSAGESKTPYPWNGKVGHWVPSLGVTGLQLRDITNNQNHGAFEASMTMDDWVIGQNGYALDFDGTDDFIDCGNPSVFEITASITISAWIYVTVFPPSPGDLYTIVEKGYDGTNEPYAFRLDNGAGVQQVHFGTFTTPTEVRIKWAHDYSVGEWHNVVGRFDGSTYKIFSDGIEKASLTDSTVLSASPTKSLNIGASDVAGMTRFFDGLIDNVRVYNRALSPSEILELYANPYADLELENIPLGLVSGFIPYPNPRYALQGGMQGMNGGLQ